MQHVHAVERSGGTEGETPAAEAERGAAKIAVAEGQQQPLEAAHVGPLFDRLLPWPPGPGQGQVSERAGDGADGEDDAETGVFLTLGEKVQELADREAGYHRDDAGDDRLATEEMGAHPLGDRVRDPGAVEGRGDVGARQTGPHHDHEGRQVGRWQE